MPFNPDKMASLRRRRGMNQRQLAELLASQPDQVPSWRVIVSRWERGKIPGPRGPLLRTVERLAWIFEVPVSALLDPYSPLDGEGADDGGE